MPPTFDEGSDSRFQGRSGSTRAIGNHPSAPSTVAMAPTAYIAHTHAGGALIPGTLMGRLYLGQRMAKATPACKLGPKGHRWGGSSRKVEEEDPSPSARSPEVPRVPDAARRACVVHQDRLPSPGPWGANGEPVTGVTLLTKPDRTGSVSRHATAEASHRCRGGRVGSRRHWPGRCRRSRRVHHFHVECSDDPCGHRGHDIVLAIPRREGELHAQHQVCLL